MNIPVKMAAIAASAVLLGGTGVLFASAAFSAAPARATVQIAPSYSGHKMWCYWGGYGNGRWMEVVPDGTIGGSPGFGYGWCKVYIDYPMYLGQFTVVAPNGARATYKPS